MATTTNYGWETPDDTDLVKDGALASRTLGSSIDTTVKNLNPETTLGDIAYRSSTANVKTRLGLGTAGQVLAVNSGATAPEWVTVSAGAMTVLASGSITNTNLSLTSISGSYTNLVLYLDMAKGGSASAYGSDFRLNTNTGAVYSTYRPALVNGGATSGVDSAGTSFRVQSDFYNSGTKFQCLINIYQYANATAPKVVDWISVGFDQTGNLPLVTDASAMFNSNTAITSIQTINTALTGDYILYGVK